MVGINTAIASHSGSNSGVAFAIPINLVKRVAKQLYDKGSVLRPECTLNNPKDFRVYRPKEGNPDGPQAWLQLRYGLAADAEPQTVNQVVHSLDISRHRVCQLEEHGLSRLSAQREIQALRVGR